MAYPFHRRDAHDLMTKPTLSQKETDWPFLREAVRLWLRRIVLALVILAALLSGARGAFAREDASVRFSGQAQGLYLAPSALDDRAGKVSVARVQADASLGNDLLTVGLALRRDAYQWEKTGSLPFGNGRTAPWQELNRIGLTATHSGSLAQDWRYFATVGGSASYEKDLDGSLGLNGAAGLLWQMTPQWRLRLGAGGVWHAVRAYPYPVVGLTYQSPDIAGLSAEIGFPASFVAYRVNEVLGIRLTGEVDYGLYRLASDSTVRRNGYVETMSYAAGLWLETFPAAGLTVRAGGGVDFGGEVSLYRESGKGEKTYTRQAAPRLGATLRYVF